MNDWLAQMYNTNGAGEEQEKVAQADFFAKLAADNNIDLSQMSQSEINALYAQVFPKMAGEDEDEDEKKKKKDDEDEDEKTSAAAYHQEKVAFQEKFAEADLMGRVMAHSFTDELNQIKVAVEAIPRPESGRGSKVLSTEQLAKGRAKAQARKGQTGGGALSGKGSMGTPDMELGKGKVDKSAMGAGRKVKSLGRRAMKAVKGLPGPAKAALLAGGGLAAGVGAAKAFGGKDKAASAEAFEELAANHAIKVASAADYDVDQAFELVNAVYTLGLEETEKVAYVQDLDTAVHVRGLEYLEEAGYPVDWSEIFEEG